MSMSGIIFHTDLFILTGPSVCYDMECLDHKFDDQNVVVTQGDQLFCTICTRKLKLIIDGQ